MGRYWKGWIFNDVSSGDFFLILKNQNEENLESVWAGPMAQQLFASVSM